MLSNEDLLAISMLLDKKLEPINDRTRNIELTLENEILPRLQNIESCYTSTYKRYTIGASQMDSIQADIDIIKKVVAGHSEQIQELKKIS